MDLRKERRKERKNKRKNKRKHLKKKESIDYNWCLYEECLESCDYFKTKDELNKHIEINHKYHNLINSCLNTSSIPHSSNISSI